MKSYLRKAIDDLFVSTNFQKQLTNNTMILPPYLKIINKIKYISIPLCKYTSPSILVQQKILAPNILFFVDINSLTTKQRDIQPNEHLSKSLPRLVGYSRKLYPSILYDENSDFKEFYLDIKKLGINNYLDLLCLLLEIKPYENTSKKEITKQLLRFFFYVPESLYAFYLNEEADFIDILKTD